MTPALSRMLGDLLAVARQTLQVEALEGRRPVRDVPVPALVDDSAGLQAICVSTHSRALARARGRTGAALTLIPAQSARFYREVKMIPAVVGVALRSSQLPRHDGREPAGLGAAESGHRPTGVAATATAPIAGVVLSVCARARASRTCSRRPGRVRAPAGARAR